MTSPTLFDQALGNVLQERSRIESICERISLGHALRESSNEAFATPVHVVGPESSGCGMSDWKRMRCTCGWIGPQRFEHQDDMSTRLNSDKSGHLTDVAGRARLDAGEP